MCVLILQDIIPAGVEGEGDDESGEGGAGEGVGVGTAALEAVQGYGEEEIHNESLEVHPTEESKKG